MQKLKDMAHIERKKSVRNSMHDTRRKRMAEPIIVSTALTERHDAERLARLLLEDKLIACAQILGPGQSLYWWQGKIEETPEIYLFLKTDRSLFKRVEQRIKAEHPYQVPEIVATPVIEGNSDYLAWMKGELSK